MAGEVTQLLEELRVGKQLAAEKLFPLVLDELRLRASRLLAHERVGHTLQTTALLNEAYLRMVQQERAAESPWQDRAHFLAVAARAMRQVLVDYARTRNRAKRGGGAARNGDRIPLDSSILVAYETSAGVDIEALNAMMKDLAEIRPRAAQIVDMRFFADMTVEEIACVLDVSMSTVEREWRFARAWLKDALNQSAERHPMSNDSDERTTCC